MMHHKSGSAERDKPATLQSATMPSYPQPIGSRSLKPCDLLWQVASTSFYLKTLPLFDAGDDVGMVLSPQCFHNLNLHADIFNHSNVHFWEYMQPGAALISPENTITAFAEPATVNRYGNRCGSAVGVLRHTPSSSRLQASSHCCPRYRRQ